jgi:hypothetical protein
VFLIDLQVPSHSMKITFHLLTVHNLQVLLWIIVIADLTFIPKSNSIVIYIIPNYICLVCYHWLHPGCKFAGLIPNCVIRIFH